MEEEIIVTRHLLEKLKNLTETLFSEGHFEFEESAVHYVVDVKMFIDTIKDLSFVPIMRKYPTKSNKRQNGVWYVRYKQSRRTTWYITFDTDDELYVIRNIINNNTQDYPAFIKGLK